MTKIHHSLILGCSVLALAGCGGDEIVSPGTGGDIIINNPDTGGGTGGGGGGGTGGVTPAAACPDIEATAGLTKSGTVSGPTGEYLICTLPSTIDTDTTLPYTEGVLYAINGRVDVGQDLGPVAQNGEASVQLNIDSGVILYGATPRSFLVVNRGNTIDAVGTVSRPIVFTSLANVQGDSTDTSIGQWGGVVLLGRAPVSDCASGVYNNNGQKSDGTGAFVQTECQQQLEGTNVATLFGGGDSTDSSGTMKYVQIRYSGAELATDKELQSLTTGGIGSGTVIDYLQTFNSSDDGMEFFGGTVRMKHVVVVGADDDSIDVDTGAQADLQYVLVKQRTAGGDNLIELDSPDGDYATEALPQTVLKVSNFTFLERSTTNSQAMRFRGGAKAILANGVLDTDNETCLRIDEQVTIDADPDFYSIVGDCDPAKPFRGINNDATTDGDVAAQWDADPNNDYAYNVDANLTGGIFFTGTVTAYDVTQLSTFFGAANYLGAFSSSTDTWYLNWTCNSATLDFGSSTGACSSLPVY